MNHSEIDGYVLGLPKYVLREKGLKVNGDIRNFLDQEWVHLRSPASVFKDIPQHIRTTLWKAETPDGLVEIDQDVIVKTFDAQQGLATLLSKGLSQERLSHGLRKLIGLLSHSLDPKDLGITSSLLLGAQNEQSDIDLVVYGRQQYAMAVRGVIESQSSGVHFRDQSEWAECYKMYGVRSPLDKVTWAAQQTRKHDTFILDDLSVILLAVRKSSDMSLLGQYNSKQRTRGNGTRLEGVVINDSESVFRPAIYELQLQNGTVKVLCSFLDVHYAAIAGNGDKMQVSGFTESDPGHPADRWVRVSSSEGGYVLNCS